MGLVNSFFQQKRWENWLDIGKEIQQPLGSPEHCQDKS